MFVPFEFEHTKNTLVRVDIATTVKENEKHNISMMPKNLYQLNVVVSVCGFLGHGKKNIEIALKFAQFHLDIFQMRQAAERVGKY